MEKFRRNKIFFPNFQIRHILRVQNTMVDKLAYGAKNSLPATFNVDSASSDWLSDAIGLVI